MGTIYLIGGPPKVGKSFLAESICKENKIPYLPLDAFRDTLHKAGAKIERSGGKVNIKEIYPFLERLVRSINWSCENYLLEGECIFPEHILRLKKYFNSEEFISSVSSKHQLKIISLFLGDQSITGDDLKERGGEHGWTKKLSKKELNQLAKSYRQLSEEIKEDCKNNNLCYYDLSNLSKENFIKKMQKIRTELINKKDNQSYSS